MAKKYAAIAELSWRQSFAACKFVANTDGEAFLFSAENHSGYDPGNQLCTDDFAGHLADNVNLSAKSIVALACYARMAEMRGEKDVAAHYRAIAEDMAAKWISGSKGGAHGGSRIVYDKPGTWSLKYNLVWDRVLGLNLFPQ